ncbi:MAG: protoporphyrinogen oxidase [Opitutales bacterium]
MENVLVIGAGISGLTAACCLKKDGYKVKVIDKRSKAGGVISTYSENSFYAEHGSNMLMITSQKIMDFIIDLGLEDKIEYANSHSKKRFFVRNSKMLAAPTNPISMIFSPLLSFGAKMRVLKEFKIPPHDFDANLSVAEFIEDRFGKEFLDYAINPFVGGIYASNPEKLSLKATFPFLWDLEQKYGSVIKGAFASAKERKSKGIVRFKTKMASFKGGMQTLINAMVAKLDADEISVKTRVLSMDYNDGKWDVLTDDGDSDTYDKIVFAVPARRLSQIPMAGNMSLSLERLKEIEYAPVVSLTLGFDKTQIKHPLDGFGVLVSEKEDFSILGSLFLSTLFNNRAPSGCVTLTNYIGGLRSPELCDLSEEELVDLTCKDLAKLVGLSGKPKFVKYNFIKKAIAQYEIGHEEYMEIIEEFEKAQSGSIKLVGSYRGGVGVGKCIENSMELFK